MTSVKSVRRPRILVVDDEVGVTQMLKIVLERHDRYEVRTENRAEKALSVAQEFAPDLILLDMLMDGLDGWQFLEEVHNWSRPLSVPIIVTTGTILTRAWAEQNGCQGFLHKPIEEDALFDEIERCLNGPQ